MADIIQELTMGEASMKINPTKKHMKAKKKTMLFVNVLVAGLLFLSMGIKGIIAAACIYILLAVLFTATNKNAKKQDARATKMLEKDADYAQRLQDEDTAGVSMTSSGRFYSQVHHLM